MYVPIYLQYKPTKELMNYGADHFIILPNESVQIDIRIVEIKFY